jgi:ribosomal protein L2
LELKVFNIELIPGKGGKMVRAAGTAAKVLGTRRRIYNFGITL